MDEKQNAKYRAWLRKGIMAECVMVLVLAVLTLGRQERDAAEKTINNRVLAIENDYIKWVDFTVSYEALCQAYDWDVKTHGSEHEIDWVELLAYTAARTGGEFGRDALKTMEKAAEKLSEGESTMEELTEDLKYYSYYKEAYDAAIGGLVGEYWEERPGGSGNSDGSAAETVGGIGDVYPAGNILTEEQGTSGSVSTDDEEPEQEGKSGIPESTEKSMIPGGGQNESTETVVDENYVKRYGLKGYFPLARGFDYTHYDDFGVGRSYGYQRKHLGHDMMGLVGTPIMAVESGVVTALGWNQYGGWRIGISSFDGKRYYYYAHLRQNYPYAEGLQEGSVVTAGDVIGYMGHTGYSTTENVNNIKIVHLHWGLQLIFDESQKEIMKSGLMCTR